MKKTVFRWIALCLVLLLALTGCDPILPNLNWYRPEVVAFKDMEYNRQTVPVLEVRQKAVLESIETGDSVEKLMEKVFSFYEGYNRYYTGYALANIYYCKDLTDSYWQTEYNYYMETGSQVDALLDQMLHALAKHPKKQELEVEGYFGEGFFDGYEGESVWDETFTALSEREAQLQAQYYDLNSQAAEMDPYSEEFYKTYGEKIAEVYAQMVQVRQEMAEHAGYTDYPSFAFEFYYGRDYTPKQAETLMKDIKKQLVELYHGIDRSALTDVYGKVSTEDQTFSYVKSCAQNIGGVVSDAFKLMETAGLYDISYSQKKYDASFEIFISNYYEPYVFVNPTGMVRDRLTFVHEFGHFANDYASFGTVAGIDVAEFFSQGMEYLSLDYADGGKELTKMKMADSLGIYVEQTMYAYFEQMVYTMDAPTKEDICEAFEKAVREFGFEDDRVDPMAFVNVPHFFISPMYVISYVVSNDAALQLYQLEQAQKGAGVAKYVENLDTTQGQFLAFVASAGLESPFAQDRIGKVRKTFEEVLR